MSTTQKEALSKWAPLIVTLISNLVIVAYGYGKLEQRMTPIEAQLTTLAHEKLAASYVTRTEYQAKVQQRDQQFAKQDEWLIRIEAKLDRLLERQNGR